MMLFFFTMPIMATRLVIDEHHQGADGAPLVK